MILIFDFRNKSKSNFRKKLKEFCLYFEIKADQQPHEDGQKDKLEDAYCYF